MNGESSAFAASIAAAVREHGQTVAIAESLTSGNLGCQLGAAEAASDWFRGGIIAYAADVKFKLLGVDPGPVVTARCARQMAHGAARLLDASIGLALTGVGGPGPEEGWPAGTVFIGLWSAAGEQTEEHHFGGDPAAVLRAATLHALKLLDAKLH